MKVKIIERPTGAVRVGTGELVTWPAVGETIDLPAVVAEGMIASGTVERVDGGEVEKRPAVTKRVETRKAKG